MIFQLFVLRSKKQVVVFQNSSCLEVRKHLVFASF